MKLVNLLACGLCLLFAGMGNLAAQDSTETKKPSKEEKVQRHTIMEKFAPDISLTAEERQQKRRDRIEEIKFRKSVIDTLDISERRRRNLLLDLKYNPFSERLNRTMAELQFEDDKDGIEE